MSDDSSYSALPRAERGGGEPERTVGGFGRPLRQCNAGGKYSCYLKNYGDLRAAFGNHNTGAARRHYLGETALPVPVMKV